MENLVYADNLEVEFRPMRKAANTDIISTIGDAEYFVIYRKLPGLPASLDATFLDADEALWHILHDVQYRDARKWYHGQEARVVIEEEDDVFVVLANDTYSKTELNDLGKKLGIDADIRFVLIRRILKRRQAF